MKALKLITAAVVLAMSITGCQKGDLTSNPNAVNANSVIPVSLIVNHLTAILIRPEEQPFAGDVYKSDQFQVSNYAKYWGTNEDTWSYSAHSYEILKYAIQLEFQANAQLGNNTNKYFAMSKFFRAYSAIWLSQRVGDIPMTQAGDINFLTPAFDTQHDVYKNSLKLLDDANTIMAGVGAPGTVFDGGDIFGLTNLQWQKVINSYRLRVLISLSKRADDNADLNVKQQFAAIVANPTTYPVMTANSDNVVYKFNATNLYPIFASGSNSYNNFMNVSKTVLDITKSTKDPRTYLMATPVTTTNVADFDSYLGADPGTALSTLQNEAATGKYSFFNAQRYLGTATGSTVEPFFFIGYPEMCFNIAEGINRGWSPLATADAKTWYDKGIAASFSNFGLNVNTNSTVNISDVGGKTLGTATTDNATFLANVTYNLASPSAALGQILTQKYVAFFMNSGWEAYYNHRRTGFPTTFSEGGTGLGTAGGKLPHRWLYPLDEINANNANYQKAVSSQYGGAETVFQNTWLTK